MQKQLLRRGYSSPLQWLWRCAMLVLLCLFAIPTRAQSAPVDETKVITLTTAKQVGEKIYLGIEADGAVRIEGVQEAYQQGQGIWEQKKYTLTSQTIKVLGNVTKLDCSNNQLTSFDVSKNEALQTLSCFYNQLTALDVSKNIALQWLECGYNQLTALDVSKNVALLHLSCSNNQLTTLDLSKNVALHELYCPNNRLTTLDVSKNVALRELHCFSNQLTDLDVSRNTALQNLHCYSNQLTTLDVSKNEALKGLVCHENQLTALDVSRNVALQGLNCSYNQLASLDVSKNTALQGLYCYSNQLSALDVSRNEVLQVLKCWGNQLITLNVSKNVTLQGLSCSHNQLTSLDVNKNVALLWLECSNNQLTSLDVSRNPQLNTLDVCGNKIALEAMTTLVNQLPTLEANSLREGEGYFFVVDKANPNEGNRLSPELATIAKSKDWKVRDYNNGRDVGGQSDWRGIEYDGEDEFYSITTEYNRSEGSVSLSVADPTQVEAGTEVSVTATPAEGYELATLTANGVDIMETKRFRVEGNTTVRVTFRKRTYSVTTNTPEHGTIRLSGASDLTAVPHGTTLSVEVSPEAGYELATLTANGTDISTTRQFAVTSDVRVEATFRQKPVVIKKYSVTLDYNEGGRIGIKGMSPEELKAVEEGTELKVSIARQEGYTLASLTANGVDIMGTKTFIVTGNTVVKATFVKQTFTLNLPKVDHAQVSVKGNPDLSKVAYGTELELEITPEEGYIVEEVKINGKRVEEPYRFRVDGQMHIAIKVKQKAYRVRSKVEGKGAISLSGASDLTAVAHGTEISVTATAEQGYELTALTANGVDIMQTKRIKITESTEIVGVFTKQAFAVSLEQGEGGRIKIKERTAEELKAVEYGTELSVSVAREEGYELATLTANGVDIMQTKRFTVTGNTIVKATFRKKTYAITLPEVDHAKVGIKGNPDLTNVTHGTELELEITPDKDYVVEEVRINGKVLQAPYRFRVDGPIQISIKVKHTNPIEQVGNQTIRLYPNPATTHLVIEGIAEGTPLRLINMVGRVVLEQKQAESGRLSVAHLDRGVYLLQVQGKTHRIVLR